MFLPIATAGATDAIGATTATIRPESLRIGSLSSVTFVTTCCSAAEITNLVKLKHIEFKQNIKKSSKIVCD